MGNNEQPSETKTRWSMVVLAVVFIAINVFIGNALVMYYSDNGIREFVAAWAGLLQLCMALSFWHSVLDPKK
jgi:hypothetical protein